MTPPDLGKRRVGARGGSCLGQLTYWDRKMPRPFEDYLMTGGTAPDPKVWDRCSVLGCRSVPAQRSGREIPLLSQCSAFL
jgi:hypothetical protein